MTKPIKLKMTAEEKRQEKISQLIAEMGGVINSHKRIDKEVAQYLNNMTLSQIQSAKETMKTLSKKINRIKGRLKKMGVEFDEHGNIMKQKGK